MHKDPAQVAVLDGVFVDVRRGIASRSARRERWRALARLALAVTVVLLVGAAVLVVSPAFWVADPEESVRLVHGRMIGDTGGHIVGVDRERRTVAISRSLFGWRPVVVSVTPETIITVNKLEGAFGDLARDLPVRVTYEVVGGARLAHAIDIGGSRADPVPTVAPRLRTPPAAAAPHSAEPPASGVRQLGRQASPAAAPPTLPSGPAPRSAPPVRRPTPSPAAVESAPSAPGAPVASSPPAVRAEPPQAAPASDAAPGVAGDRGATENESADGRAAIDWLFNQTPGR
jgi:hypothetical protein